MNVRYGSIVGFDAVAGDDSHRHCGLDGRLAEKVQTQLGILAVSVEQRAMDRVGLAGPCLRTHRAPGLSGLSKYPRSDEESYRGSEYCLVNPVLSLTR